MNPKLKFIKDFVIGVLCGCCATLIVYFAYTKITEKSNDNAESVASESAIVKQIPSSNGPISVCIGMTTNDVEDRLGKPTKVQKEEGTTDELWLYSSHNDPRGIDAMLQFVDGRLNAAIPISLEQKEE